MTSPLDAARAAQRIAIQHILECRRRLWQTCPEHDENDLRVSAAYARADADAARRAAVGTAPR